uniref:Uncharacterized protein n=1 Tax=Romanomermis culicivorax TaxID=13658 RepID=A0A915L4Y0_ROMCU
MNVAGFQDNFWRKDQQRSSAKITTSEIRSSLVYCGLFIFLENRHGGLSTRSRLYRRQETETPFSGLTKVQITLRDYLDVGIISSSDSSPDQHDVKENHIWDEKR